MHSQAIQDVIDARLKSVRDNYMDEGAMLALRQDLLHETRAEQVAADVLPGTRTLKASVWVAGVQYDAQIELSQDVPHIELVNVPAHTELVRDDLNAPSPEEQHEADVQHAVEASEQQSEDADRVHEDGEHHG